jgi:hypothetical protein
MLKSDQLNELVRLVSQLAACEVMISYRYVGVYMLICLCIPGASLGNRPGQLVVASVHGLVELEGQVVWLVE